MTDQDCRAKAAWRNAAACVVLNLIGMPLEIAIVRTVPGMSAWPAFASMAAGAILLTVLMVRRRTASRALGNAIFLINVGVIITAIWILDAGFAVSGRVWVPFQEYKLGMLTVALLGPDAWVGAISIGAYTIAALIQMVTLSPDVRDQLALGEPYATLAFMLFSIVLLAYHLRRASLERDVLMSRARMENATHLSRVLLAIRDLANTPLQTIAFAAETARAAHDDTAAAMDRIDRALGRLRLLDRSLRGLDQHVTWDEREESLDAEAIAAAAAQRMRERR